MTPFTELRIDTRGENYVDSAGNTWVPDQPYTLGSWGYTYGSNGGTYTSPNTVTGTNDPLLYQTERWFATTPGSYTFDVPNGPYEVELRFAEIFGRLKGQRVFNVAINGTLVLQNLDIAGTVGNDVALSRTFPVTVTGNQLAISMIPITDSAKISAIRVTNLAARTGTPTTVAATATATATTPPAATFTATAAPATSTATSPAGSSPTATISPTRTATPAVSPTATATTVPGLLATPTGTPDLSLDSRISALERRYQNLLDLVTRLVQILSMFGGLQ